MGIHDREWYRGGARRTSFTPRTAVGVLIAINVVVFFLGMMFGGSGWHPAHDGFGAVPSDVFERFMVWELVTANFVHGGVGHLLINMFVLWMFGPMVERALGKRRFLVFFLVAGILGTLAQVIINYSMAGLENVPIIGASASVMGVLVYLTMLQPNLTVLLFFILPVRILWVTIFYVAYDLYQALSNPYGPVANVGHLGGALFGFLYYRYTNRPGGRWAGSPLRAGVRTEKARAKEMRKREKENRKWEELQREMDRLLEKIHRDGLDSLSSRERDFLKDASRRLRERDR